jgi:geranylgeranyl diphosphate synthase, type I
MHEFFEKSKPLIIAEMRRQAEAAARALARVNDWGPDAVHRLTGFAAGGKMVRGGLVLLAARMHGRALSRPLLAAAAAMELLHSALLVHDDIMDNDRLRRGAETIFAQYEKLARGAGRAAGGFGRSMGICAGDVGFFLAWDILARLAVQPPRRSEVLGLVAREMCAVGAAQMQDMAFATFRRLPGPDEVLDLYLYKTARYTFSLPLACGAVLAGAGEAAVRRLARLGTYLGVVFQIRDDDLGMFGSRARTGKPVGSDIREGKKTLLALEVLRRARGAERKRLASLYGKKGLSAAEIASVREAAVRLGARGRMQDLAADLAAEAARIIETLDAPRRHRDVLLEVCAESLRRQS